ncbi:MAG: hypothetical protein LBG96_03205 [Tannerella sp.]|jgi:hypothetical protein|nr:hypothetical protein [Tannerella sp.]
MKTEVIESVKADLAALDEMNEEEAMSLYNTDSKAETVRIIIDWHYMMTPGEERYDDFIKEIRKAI